MIYGFEKNKLLQQRKFEMFQYQRYGEMGAYNHNSFEEYVAK
jgi:hypothetical protein